MRAPALVNLKAVRQTAVTAPMHVKLERDGEVNVELLYADPDPHLRITVKAGGFVGEVETYFMADAMLPKRVGLPSARPAQL